MGKKSTKNLGRLTNPYFRGLTEVGFSEDKLKDLGEVQLKILYNLVVDFKTVSQIKEERRTSKNAVYNVIKKLKAKTLLDNLLRPILNSKSYEKIGGGFTNPSTPKLKRDL